jgi:hypothetical protein
MQIELKDIADKPTFDATDGKALPFLENEVPIDIIRGATTYSACFRSPFSPYQYL